MRNELSKKLQTLITIKNNEGIKSIDIPKKIHCSFTYINAMVSHLKNEGLVSHTVEGRSKPLHITKKGRETLEDLQDYIGGKK